MRASLHCCAALGLGNKSESRVCRWPPLSPALHEPGYVPPTPAMQRFADVPPSNPFYAHIEEMAVRGITLGCGGGNYCPTASVTRAQMAAFLVRAFNL